MKNHAHIHQGRIVPGKLVRYYLQNGYTPHQIMKILTEEGYSRRRIHMMIASVGTRSRVSKRVKELLEKLG